MSDNRLICFSLIAYGCYNLWTLNSSKLLNRLNSFFYCGIIFISLLWMIIAQKKQAHLQQHQDKEDPTALKTSNKPLNNPRRNIVKIDKLLDKQIQLGILQQLGGQDTLKTHDITIYKVQNDQIEQRFSQRQAEVSQKTLIQGNAGTANTNFAFHGTKKTCKGIGVFPCSKFHMSECSFCNILTNGFSNTFSGKGMCTDLRYRKGTYFSPSMNKALAYCQSDEKVLLACRIVMGRVFRPHDEEHFHLYFDNNRYESVLAEPGITVDVKQPEICIQDDAGCIVDYVLIFQEK